MRLYWKLIVIQEKEGLNLATKTTTRLKFFSRKIESKVGCTDVKSKVGKAVQYLS